MPISQGVVVMGSGLAAEPVIGPAEGRTRWRRPGTTSDAVVLSRIPVTCMIESVLSRLDTPQRRANPLRQVPSHFPLNAKLWLQGLKADEIDLAVAVPPQERLNRGYPRGQFAHFRYHL